MVFWKRALRDLRQSDKTFRSIFGIVFGFSDNVFCEISRDGRIERITYARCEQLVLRLAQALGAHLRDVPQDAFVALRLDNCPEWVVAFWAILMAGYRPLLVNTRMDAAGAERILASVETAAVLSDQPMGGRRFLDVFALLEEQPAAGGFEPRWADGVALSTSGTSGSPKLCVFTGAAIAAQILNTEYVIKTNRTIVTKPLSDIRILAFLPFYHIFGLTAVLLWFSFFGRTFVFLRDMRPVTILDACKRHGVTHLFAIPLLWSTVAESVRREAAAQGEETAKRLEKALRLSLALQNAFPRLGRRIAAGLLFKRVRERIVGSKLRFCISGGGHLGEETLRLVNGLGYPLYNGYGMTEIGIASVELRLPAKRRVEGSVGKPFPSLEFSLRPEGDAPDRGELLVRGSSLFQSYYENGRVTHRRPDEWFATGDVFTRDAKGNYFIFSRKDDLIVDESGENISPDTLEAHFRQEHVRRLCVVGVPDGRGRPVITLVLELAPDLRGYHHKQLLSALHRLNEQLPLNTRVRRFLVSEEPLPVVLESKVQRAVVRRRLAEGAFPCHELTPRDEGTAEEILSEAYAEVLAAVRRIFAEVLGCGEEQVGETSHFLYDLSGNSLQYFTLADRITNEFHVTFQFSGTSFFTTPQEFAKYIISR